MPVRPADLALVADDDGRRGVRGRAGRELADAYDQIRDSLGDTLGEEIEIVKELTWRWAAGAFALLASPGASASGGSAAWCRPGS